MNRIFPGVITMPLQIRRGTNAERTAMVQPLAAGELLYVTDTQRIYVGNGSTLGGIAVTGYTNDDAQDAAASLFTTATHSGISFDYDDALNTLTATVDFSQFSGPLIADSVKGSVFADDSTILVDGVSGRIVGPVFANVTGDVTGNVTGNLTGNVTGNVTGNLTGNVTGNVTGSVVGDIRGSVFGDDSTILVDALSNLIRTNTAYLSQVYSINSVVSIGSGTQLSNLEVVGNTSEPIVLASAAVSGTAGLSQPSPFVRIAGYRGTYSSKSVLQLNDAVGQLNFQGRVNAGTYGVQDADLVSIRAVIEDEGDLSSVIADAKLQFIFVHGPDPADAVTVEMSSQGVITSRVIKTTVYSAAGTALPSASTAGMGARAFVSDATAATFGTAYTGGGSNKVPVYSDGTAWYIG